MSLNLVLSPFLTGQQQFDNAGLPLSNGFVYTYVNRTTQPIITYSDLDGTPNDNPIPLDSSGRLPNNIYIDIDLIYTFVVKDADLAEITEAINDINAPPGTGSGGVTFPLIRSAVDSTTNSDIKWVSGSDLVDGNTRIRGTINDEGNTVMICDAWVNNGWTVMWKGYVDSSFCGDQLVMEIPTLKVDNFFTGTNVVKSVAQGPGTYIPFTTGNVTVSLLSPMAGSSASAGTVVANTETYITNPAFVMQRTFTGDCYRITLAGTCTSTGGNTQTFNVRYGTSGNLTDPVKFSFNLTSAVSGTDIPFKIEIMLNIVTNGSNVFFNENMTLMNFDTTGISTTQFALVNTTSSSLAPTGSDHLGVSYASGGATTTTTFKTTLVEYVR